MRGYLDHISLVIPVVRPEGRAILAGLGIKGEIEFFGVLVKEVA